MPGLALAAGGLPFQMCLSCQSCPMHGDVANGRRRGGTAGTACSPGNRPATKIFKYPPATASIRRWSSASRSDQHVVHRHHGGVLTTTVHMHACTMSRTPRIRNPRPPLRPRIHTCAITRTHRSMAMVCACDRCMERGACTSCCRQRLLDASRQSRQNSGGSQSTSDRCLSQIGRRFQTKVCIIMWKALINSPY